MVPPICENSGCSSIWLTAGTTVKAAFRSSKCLRVKLQTPIARTRSQANHSMFGSGICAEPGDADQAALRGAIDDGPAALHAQLPQLVLHAVEDAPQIDGDDAVEIATLDVRGVGSHDVDAGIVESGIQAAERGDHLLDHGLDRRLVDHVAP